MPHLAHVTLVVADYDEALAFYVGKLGFELVEDTAGPEQGKRWVVIRPPGAEPDATTILLARAATEHQASRIGDQTGGRVSLFLHTDDLARDHARFTAAGVEWVRPPTRQPYGTVAVFADLYGNLWDLIEPPPPACARATPRGREPTPAPSRSPGMRSLPVAAALLLAAACSPAPTEAPAPTPTPTTAASATPAPPPTATPSPTPTATPAAADILTLEGLGALRIGRPIPAGSGWASRGAQIPDTPCRTISSPRFPGVYAIVEDGVVRRISVGERSAVRLVEGIGPGSPERAVRDAFPGFRETPHDYVAAPGKNLTTPSLAAGDTGLRFEIDGEGRVGTMHVGTVPVLGYSEGCA